MNDRSIHEKIPGKRNTVRAAVILCVAVALFFVLTGSGNDHEAAKIVINAPSAGESVIAPGRHFKVSGSLSGMIPDDATLRVALLDADGNELRYAAADQKGTGRVIPSVAGGDIAVFVENTDFSDVAYTAPEFAVADTDDPEASAHDATVKCVYTDEDFYALIVSATDPEHGLAEADGFELVDHEGRPYEALPEGKYTVQVVMSSADGKELASSSEEFEIGRTDGTIIHEITTLTAIEKGGMDLLSAWAADENLTILVDLLPGFFGPEYQMSILPMSVSCETAEYLPGRIKMLVYGNTSISASYGLEVARYLQLEHNVENPDIAEYYVFDLGEPSLAGEQARIIKLDDDENIHICRIDHVMDETEDGVFLTSEEQLLGSDTDPSDGWKAENGAFAVAGAMKPYQLKDDELVPSDFYGFYQFLNGADSLVYQFTPADGSDAFSIQKDVGVRRIDQPGDASEPALYEFYNVFPENTLQAGNSYDVTVQAYDRKGAAVEGAVCEFTLDIQEQETEDLIP